LFRLFRLKFSEVNSKNRHFDRNGWLRMDRKSRSEHNESTFSRNIDSLNSCEMDSWIDELKNSVPSKGSGVSSWSRREGLSLSKESLVSPSDERGNSFFETESSLEKKRRNTSSEGNFRLSESDNVGRISRYSSVSPLGLPVPGKRLQSLMNRVNTVQRYRNTSWDQGGDLGRTASGKTDFFSGEEGLGEHSKTRSGSYERRMDPLDRNIQHCEELLEQLVQSRSQSQANNSDETSVSENSEKNITAEKHVSENLPVSAEMEKEERNEIYELNEVSEIKTEKKTSQIWHGILFGAELSLGLLFGLGMVFFSVNSRNPIEKRVFHEFQRAVPSAEMTCDISNTTSDGSEMIFGPIVAKAVSEQDRSQDFHIQKTTLSLYPVSRVSRALRMRSVTLDGVEFPNLGTSALADSWRPAPIAPLFSDEIKTVLADKNNSLESLRYLEEVKGKHLPVYQEISAEVTRINTEMEKLQAQLMEKLKLEKWNPEILKSEEAKRPEVVEDLTQIGELRREAVALQSRWMELNQTVASDLALVREKIAQDGKAFSSILHFANPTDSVLNEYLFKTDIQKRLAESVAWIGALSRMAEMGMLARSRYSTEKLKTNGNIELFGQNFCFSSDWDSMVEEDSNFSYRGTLQLDSDTIPSEYLNDAFVSISGKEKDKSLLRTVSARIPLPNDVFTWGDFASLPLHGHAQNVTVVLSLTIFKNELNGSITLEMEQVAFDPPESNAEKAAILFKQFETKVIPSVQIAAKVSGTLAAPVLEECSSSAAQDLGPLWEIALQEIHQKTRKEMITAIYEQLKNAETGFNGTLEPFYQEMLVCAQKTDLFKDFPLLKGRISSKVPSREAIVEVVPMNIAHLEVNRTDLDENIPTYDPNLGIAPIHEPVAAPVGNQVQEPVKTIKKSVPVKKVSSIEPLPVPQTVAADAKSDKAESVPGNVSIPASEPKSVPEMPKAVSSENQLDAGQKMPPVPNVADPVFYSTKQKKELKPMDIPVNKKSSMPLPMMKSTSHFGS